MSVDKNKLKKVAKSVLKILEKEELRLNEIIFLSDKRDISRDYISITLRPSSNSLIPKGMALTISYISDECGIPMEIRINKVEGYSRIILKSNKLLPGYNSFARDIYGNIAQDKKIETTDINLIKKELEKLCKYLS